MYSMNPYDNHKNIYNMIKITLFKILMQLRYVKKYLKYLLINKYFF